MKVIGYGEDSLTLWALTHRTKEILKALNNSSQVDSCTIFFRPSFGRSGGPQSSQFGEFDFILATPQALYLGEAKWENSPELAESIIRLRDEQLERHKIFTTYYRTWISKPEWVWESYLAECFQEFKRVGILKTTPPSESLLSNNMKSILRKITHATGGSSIIENVLLIVDSTGKFRNIQKIPPQGFTLVMIDASRDIDDGFISLMK